MLSSIPSSNTSHPRRKAREASLKEILTIASTLGLISPSLSPISPTMNKRKGVALPSRSHSFGIRKLATASSVTLDPFSSLRKPAPRPPAPPSASVSSKDGCGPSPHQSGEPPSVPKTTESPRSSTRMKDFLEFHAAKAYDTCHRRHSPPDQSTSTCLECKTILERETPV